jgi:cbb3-type cytochrome oxidase cytochrome c subunit
MVKVRQILFISLTLIPMLLGLAHNISSCFAGEQSLESISHISDFSAENTSGEDCHKDDDCSHCCSLSHTVVIATKPSLKLSVVAYTAESSFEYSFNPKTIVLPTPEKPPRA